MLNWTNGPQALAASSQIPTLSLEQMKQVSGAGFLLTEAVSPPGFLLTEAVSPPPGFLLTE